MDIYSNEKAVRPLEERMESQRENIVDLLEILEEDAWYLTTRLREAQATVGRVFTMEDMLNSRRKA